MIFKNQRFQIFSICILAIYLQSCITASIVSNKSPDFTNKISKIYVLSRSSPASKAYVISATNLMSQKLNAKGITNTFYYMDELALESEKSILKKVEEYKPDVYMIMSETERRTKVGQFGITTNTGCTMDLKMFIPDRETPVWRATLTADGSMGVEEAYEKAALYFMEKLKADGIIQ